MMFITNIIKLYHKILKVSILYWDKEISIMGNIFDYSNGEFFLEVLPVIHLYHKTDI